MWPGIWSAATIRIGFWTWIWSTSHCGLGQEVACWFQCWKNSFRLTDLITLVLLMWKWLSVLEEKSSFKKLGWHFLPNWIGALTLSLLLELPPRKLELWFVQQSFVLLRLLCISMNLPYAHAWNTVVISGLVFLVATWNCWMSYKNGYAGLLVLHSLPLLNPWLIAEM